MKQFLLLLFLPFLVISQTEGTITNGNAKIYYRTFGSGTPMLIINGGPGMNSNGFVPLAEKLSARNLTILYDQRGTGKSTIDKTDTSTITMDLMVTDIETLRKHLKIEKWVILGHSFGGMLASYYATKHPETIESMIMSSSGGIDLGLFSNGNSITEKLSSAERDSLNYWNAKIDKGDTSFAARIGRGRAMAPAYVYNKKHVGTIAQRLTEGNSLVNGLVWQNMRKINFNCAPALINFEKPVFIIQGKNDILDLSIAQKIKSAFKNTELLLLDKCGHYGWLDREKDYYAAIENFLKPI